MGNYLVKETDTDLLALSGLLPVPRWTWIDRRRNCHLPEHTASRHLFFTLRMIWNNTVAPHERVGDVILYDVDPTIYTSEYFAEAVRNLGEEIQTRTDLLPEWTEQLKQMIPGFEVRGRIR